MRNSVLGERYRIMDRLGEGGMAVVYVALDEKLGRQVAIKVLHQQFADNADIRQRFEQEATAISAMDHPNILKVFDYSGRNSEQLWIVAEYLKGKNLSRFVAEFPGAALHPILASCVVLEVCKALDHAHSHQMIHRDIKPENVMVLDNGRIKLMDFGIAKNLHAHTSMTQTGTFMGSPSYMSPEQIRGTRVGNVIDIYSLGVLFYEIVTGRLPYVGNNTHDVIMKITEGRFTQPAQLNPAIPGELNRVICKAMARDVERRYQTARGFGRELAIVLRRHGFMESHVELERFFIDRPGFELRLAEMRGVKSAKTQNINQSRSHSRTTKDRISIYPELSRDDESQETRYDDPAQLKQTLHIQAHNDQALFEPRVESINAKENLQEKKREALARADRRDHMLPKRATPPVPKIRSSEGQSHHQEDKRARKIAQPSSRASESKIQSRRVRPKFPHRQRPQDQWKHQVRLKLQRKSGFVPIFGLLFITGLMLFIGMNLSRLKDRVHGFSHRVLEQSSSLPVSSQNEKQIQSGEKAAEVVVARGGRAEAEHFNSNKREGSSTSNSAKKRTGKPIAVPSTITRSDRKIEFPANKKAADTHAPRVAALKTRPESLSQKQKVDDNLSDSVSTSYIKIAANVSANISIDGSSIGTTVDETFNSGWKAVSPGRHLIVVTRPGYKPYKKNLTLEVGQRLKLENIQLSKSELKAITVPVSIYSEQIPVDVRIVDLKSNKRKKKIMKKKHHRFSVPPGNYRVVLAHGGKEVVKVIQVVAGAPLVFTIDFMQVK